MEPIDLSKQYRDLYAPSARAFSLVQVPPLQFLMVDGRGNPNTWPAYREAIKVLYAVAYGLKFGLKRPALPIGPSCLSKDSGGPRTRGRLPRAATLIETSMLIWRTRPPRLR